FALLGVDLGMNVRFGPVARPRRLGDGVLHRGDHDATIDRFLARDRVCDLQQFKFIGADSGHGFSLLWWVRFRLGAVLLRPDGVPWCWSARSCERFQALTLASARSSFSDRFASHAAAARASARGSA